MPVRINVEIAPDVDEYWTITNEGHPFGTVAGRRDSLRLYWVKSEHDPTKVLQVYHRRADGRHALIAKAFALIADVFPPDAVPE